MGIGQPGRTLQLAPVQLFNDDLCPVLSSALFLDVLQAVPDPVAGRGDGLRGLGHRPPHTGDHQAAVQPCNRHHHRSQVNILIFCYTKL
jgi:hypothetical protein